MFRELVLKPVTDTAQPAMTELRNFAEQADDSYTTIDRLDISIQVWSIQWQLSHNFPNVLPLSGRILL